ncbi:PQQ-binding-like beta-propeller repeat protein, partial [candidate division WOR-3 bacterium]|nr:PQQ-binding-like beta-propeller repeat protein [candidate division WOR-3 bacterium]MBD3364392.1 PQQ-binding-like beta-propeller repeat protein [candidate division WOR-3 bacterium]
MKRVLLILGFTFALSWAQDEVETEVHAEWIFETETDDGFATSVIVGPDTTIYIGSYDGYIYALSPEGELKWKYTPFESGIDASRILRPAIGLDGNILITSNSTLYVLTPDGDIVWDYDTKGSWYTCPAIDSRGNVYVGGGRTLFSLTSDGEIRWKHKSKGNIDAQSVTPDGSIYFWS